MKKIFLSLYVITLAILVISCGQSTSSSRSTGEPEKRPQQKSASGAYEWKSVSAKDEMCEEKEFYRCAHVLLDYPVFTGDQMTEANKRINHYIADLVGYGDAESDALIDLEKVARGLIKDFQDSKPEALGSPQLWHIRLKSKFIHEKDNLFCLMVVSESFMGGAHASMNKAFLTFDGATGQAIHVLDRVADKVAFKQLAEEKFRKKRGLLPGADLNVSGYQFPGNEFVLPANIGIDEKGYWLHYNPYEVAPYEKGPTDIRIEFEELQ